MKPLTLNLRTNDAQGGLIPGFEGQPLPTAVKEKRVATVPAALELHDDRPTAVNCVPVRVVIDDGQGSFDL